MRSSRQWVRHAFFTLTEHGAVRVLDALITLMLIRSLATSHFGLFSVYQSWVSVLLLFFPAVELALFREYGVLKREGRLASELALYRFFNYVKLLMLTAVVVGLAFIPQDGPWSTRVALLAFAFALPISQAFYGFMREPLRFEMRSHLVAGVSAAQRVLLLAAILGAAHFWPGDIPALVLSALGIYVVVGFGWGLAARDLFVDLDFVPKNFFKRLQKVFFETVIWFHITGVMSQALQTFDIFSLNLFKTDLAEIGRYSIALKAANFFQIIPIAAINTFGVYLARERGKSSAERERKLVALFLISFAVLCLGFLVLGTVVGKPLLVFLSKGAFSGAALDRAYLYFRWLLAGVLLLCASYPLSTYLAGRAKLPQLFWWINVPWFVCTAATYFWAARISPMTLAKMNVPVYLLNGVLLVFFYFFKYQRTSSKR